MIAHFREAQANLSALPTAADVFHQQPPHQANSVATIADMVAQRLLDAMPTEDAPPLPAAPIPPIEHANAATQRESDLQSREAALQTQMQEMMALMRSTSTSNNSHRNRPNTYNRGRGRGDDRNTGRGRGRSNDARAGPRKYCWSHGSCAHDGAACNTTQPGHKTAATFANMQGGSTSGCYWLDT